MREADERYVLPYLARPLHSYVYCKIPAREARVSSLSERTDPRLSQQSFIKIALMRCAKNYTFNKLSFLTTIMSFKPLKV